MPFIGAVAVAEPQQGYGGKNELLEDIRVKTLRRSTPSSFDAADSGYASTRLANSTTTRYSGSQAMSLTRG